MNLKDQGVQLIPYVPEILPNETISSLLGRLHLHLGSPPVNKFNYFLFSNQQAYLAPDLPSKISTVAEKLTLQYGVDANDLMHRHTLAPYYARYLPAEVWNTAASAMLENSKSLQKRFHTAKVPHHDAFLRFCPECIVDMVATYGEAYWKLDHQIPIVLVCPQHGCVLRFCQTNKPPTFKGFVAATPLTCPDNAKPVIQIGSDREYHLLKEIAAHSVKLLYTKSGTMNWKHIDKTLYRTRLKELGFMESSTRISLIRLEEKAMEKIGPLRHIFSWLFDKNGNCGFWLRRLLQPNSQIYDPCFHTMLDLILREESLAHQPFGEGPWPCLNPISDHNQLLTITNAGKYKSGQNYVYRFMCFCGYTYLRSVKPDGSLTRPICRAYGETLRPLLARALSEGWGVRRAATEAQISPSTLRTAAHALGFGALWPVQYDRKSTLTKKMRKLAER